MARFPSARVNADEQRQLRAALYRPLPALTCDERTKIVDLIIQIVTAMKWSTRGRVPQMLDVGVAEFVDIESAVRAALDHSRLDKPRYALAVGRKVLR